MGIRQHHQGRLQDWHDVELRYAGRLTETILVGNLALRAPVGERIEWDAVNLRSTNVESVNKFVDREYRSGWEIEQAVGTA